MLGQALFPATVCPTLLLLLRQRMSPLHVLLRALALRLLHTELAHRRALLQHRHAGAVPAQQEAVHRSPVRELLRMAHRRRTHPIDLLVAVPVFAQQRAKLVLGHLLVALLLFGEFSGLWLWLRLCL